MTGQDRDGDSRRNDMVDRQIVFRDIADARVIEAMRRVPREAFVAPEYRDRAFHDTPLPIGDGQTISQPYIVALMAASAAIAPGDRVLDVGTGSGYGAAVLSHLARTVCSVERHPALAEAAATRLRDLGYANVEVRCGDGSAGWPGTQPFDAILVAAGGPVVPDSLLAQLAPGGRLVIPVGPRRAGQRLLKLTRGPEQTRQEDLGLVSFVPLIGLEGWDQDAGG